MLAQSPDEAKKHRILKGLILVLSRFHLLCARETRESLLFCTLKMAELIWWTHRIVYYFKKSI